jgi:small subunit ribosomal protein S2
MSYQPKISIKDLLTAGAHYGHKKELWNPKMSPYIHGVKEKIHIINLEITAQKLDEALKVLFNIAADNGRILFVNTKKQSSDIVEEAATRCGQYYINHRWLGGILTNWKTVSSSIKTLQKYEYILADEDSSHTKKELLEITRKKEKLDRAIGGIRNLGGMPDILFVNDVNMHSIAVEEALHLGIPIIGIVDSNSSPDNIDYVIPANDDSRKSIGFFSNIIADAIIAGMQHTANISTQEQDKKKAAATEKIVSKKEIKTTPGDKEKITSSHEDKATSAKKENTKKE